MSIFKEYTVARFVTSTIWKNDWLWMAPLWSACIIDRAVGQWWQRPRRP